MRWRPPPPPLRGKTTPNHYPMRRKRMDQEIKAPMPGTIVDILVQVGDQVEAEQDLVVLESMKMENVISSRSGGRVTAIEVEVGQNVTANKVLARVAAA
jgi:biotin carboxyl carrier protein